MGEQPMVEKKRPKPGAVSTLVDDYGVEHINGYDADDERGMSEAKAAFLKDTRAYLKQLAKLMEVAGFTTRTNKKVESKRVST